MCLEKDDYISFKKVLAFPLPPAPSGLICGVKEMHGVKLKKKKKQQKTNFDSFFIKSDSVGLALMNSAL